MSSDSDWIGCTKMAVTSLFVTAATTVAERLGATVGALVATLPVSAGPVYVFLALDHDSAFISASAVASLALNSATAIYLTAYVLIAQRRSMWPSISLAFAIWLVAVLLLSLVDWTAWLAFALNIAVFTVCSFVVQPFGCRAHPANHTALVRLRVKSGFGGRARRRSYNFEFPDWSDGKRYLGCVSGHLHEHHADSAWPYWRPCHRSRAGERRSCARGIWRGIADLASHRGATWIRAGACRRARHLGRLECHYLCDATPPISRLISALPFEQHQLTQWPYARCGRIVCRS